MHAPCVSAQRQGFTTMAAEAVLFELGVRQLAAWRPLEVVV
jgi:hypothetical protein